MRRRRTACLLILAVSLAACTSFKVNTDHDPTVDFSSFKTFAFAGPSEMNKGGIYDNSLTRRRIESAVVRELTGKGLRQVGLDEPQDILVHYWVNIQDKQRLDSTGPTVGVARYPGGYGWGAGYGGGVNRKRWLLEHEARHARPVARPGDLFTTSGLQGGRRG